jgi:ABC-type multidrug transport system fused ATPase/permease subunit
MENGRVVESGSPEELLFLGGIYKRVHDMQSAIDDENFEGIL